MVLEGVFLNDIGVFRMRETVSGFSNAVAAVLVVRKTAKLVGKQ
jgi:hypothetical protein